MVPLRRASAEISAFQISFSYDNRIVAQKVTADLVSRFMTENTRERTTQSVLTTQFLKDQLENAKKELDTIEAKADEFPHERELDGLPDQVQQNATQMAMLEQRISNLNSALAVSVRTKCSSKPTCGPRKSAAALAPTAETAVRRQRTTNCPARIARSCSSKLRFPRFANTTKILIRTFVECRPNSTPRRRLREKFLAEEERSELKNRLAASKRVDPMYEREARQLDAVIERLETQLQAKDAEAKTYQETSQTPRRVSRLSKAALSRHPSASSNMPTSFATGKLPS